MLEKPEIEIIEEIIKGDPELKIYRVSIKTDTGEWKEVCGSKELLRHFMRGVQAGFSLKGIHITIPEPKISRE
jgi:hypothetical protein